MHLCMSVSVCVYVEKCQDNVFLHLFNTTILFFFFPVLQIIHLLNQWRQTYGCIYCSALSVITESSQPRPPCSKWTQSSALDIFQMWSEQWVNSLPWSRHQVLLLRQPGSILGRELDCIISIIIKELKVFQVNF